TQLAQVDVLAEGAEHHGQAGRSAVGVFHLPDAGDTPAHGALPVPSIAPNWRARTSASGSERSTTVAWVCRCASCAAGAAPGSSWPVTKMAGWAGGTSPARRMDEALASCACRPVTRTGFPPGSVTVSPRELARSGPAAAGSRTATVPVRPLMTAGPVVLSSVRITHMPATATRTRTRVIR